MCPPLHERAHDLRTRIENREIETGIQQAARHTAAILPTPTKPILSVATLHAHFLEDFFCDSEAIDAGRDPAIDSYLQEDFFDLVLGDSVGERALT